MDIYIVGQLIYIVSLNSTFQHLNLCNYTLYTYTYTHGRPVWNRYTCRLGWSQYAQVRTRQWSSQTLVHLHLNQIDS